ncbi:MAG: carboxypeptidase regulatory-like domain-containing protein, partial [Chloroflexota bacterium]|nr:carboxypeptidase regulatory-like domain-containing protein [Chloroflexota bacterium]
ARNEQAANPARHAGKSLLRLVGWLVAGLLVSGLVFFTTSDDLEIVLLRNNVEWGTMQFWRGVAGDERFDAGPTGLVSGRVSNRQGEPVNGAAVIVSGVSGQVYSARTAPDGSYKIQGVPAGNYLPMSVAPAHRQAAAGTFGGRVTTVRQGQEATGVNFVLERNRPLELASEVEMSMGQPEEVTVPNPQPSTAVRRSFSFRNGGLLLDGGLVHEPLDEMGAGPFPILLIVYPGEASAWEGVSVPLATNGYVVISYFPRRLLDLEGDVDDLRVLTSLAASGRLSERGDTSRMVLVGGSVSTVYTYLMAREMEGSRVEEQVQAAIQYGGLFDMFRYRLDWEQGKIVIDPGISDLEYLLVAFGRPDSRPEVYVRFSPHYALGPDSLPPTLLVHAGNDIVVPVEQSHITDRELARLGTPHEFLLYPNIEHYLDTSKRDPTQIDMLNKTLEFLQEHVKR